MVRFLSGILIFVICLLPLGSVWAEEAKAAADQGWVLPYIGAGRGQWDASVGLFLHQNGRNVDVRNLQLRTDIDLAPGLRWHSSIRSNSKFDSLQGVDPRLDENYIEAYAFHKAPEGTLSTSLRVGDMRYLHFPYPDAISVFDTVPSTGDLRGGSDENYSGQLLTLDYAHQSGFGLHASGIHWSYGRSGGTKSLEEYVYYRRDLGDIHVETHVGNLASRVHPLGENDKGYNAYIGTISKGCTFGLFYEKTQNQPYYTGVMVTFPMDPVTKALGSVAFDWDRRPDGFAFQVQLGKGTIGGIYDKAPDNAELVGEVSVERIRTYSSSGQVRNYYEHRLNSWGETGASDLIVVMEEQPWYLQAEAAFSPHKFSEGFSAWDRDRTGPAQLSQTAVYKFYRLKK